jgi:hypothetical protein
MWYTYPMRTLLPRGSLVGGHDVQGGLVAGGDEEGVGKYRGHVFLLYVCNSTVGRLSLYEMEFDWITPALPPR